MHKLIAAVVVVSALSLPGLARAAGPVSLWVHDEPLGGRALAGATAPARPFNMVGLHWQGPGSVRFRVHRSGGRWLAWQQADADSGPGSVAATAAGPGRWHDGNLVWTGAADRLEVRVQGTVTRVRSYRLWSAVERLPRRTLATTGSPAIVARSGWGAEEEIVRGRPRYSASLQLAIVHHTVNSNAYTPAQAASIVRGIELYHVQGNGWNDIGYNFLIDRFGTVYEGRAGGIGRNVVGAHALGFNQRTVGVALIGNFQDATPPPAMQQALVRLLAWRLDLAHVDPLSTVSYVSGGSIRFKPGVVVRLRAISGHRDTYYTECPGNGAYALLARVAREVAATGLPKLYAPVVSGTLGGPVRFQATLSGAAFWRVTVTTRTGALVARATGRGAVVDWTWTSTPGQYLWTIQSAGSRPASGALGGVAPVPVPTPAPTPTPTPTPTPVPLTLTALAVAPATLLPDATGAIPAAGVSFQLSAQATVTATVVDANGVPVAAVFSGVKPAGLVTLPLDAASLPDGRYGLVVAARHAGAAAVTAAAAFVVDRGLSSLVASSPVISPNGDGTLDTLTLTFTLAAPVPVSVVVQRAGAVVATVFQGPLAAGPQTVSWDGTSGGGVRLPDGAYTAVVTWTDAQGDVSASVPVSVDTTPPALILLDATGLRFSLSEPATVAVVVNGGPVVGYQEPAGLFTVPVPPEGLTGVWAQATDAAGNVAGPLTG